MATPNATTPTAAAPLSITNIGLDGQPTVCFSDGQKMPISEVTRDSEIAQNLSPSDALLVGEQRGWQAHPALLRKDKLILALLEAAGVELRPNYSYSDEQLVELVRASRGH